MGLSNPGAKVGWSSAQVGGGGEQFLCPLFVVLLLFVVYPLSDISSSMHKL